MSILGIHARVVLSISRIALAPFVYLTFERGLAWCHSMSLDLLFAAPDMVLLLLVRRDNFDVVNNDNTEEEF